MLSNLFHTAVPSQSTLASAYSELCVAPGARLLLTPQMDVGASCSLRAVDEIGRNIAAVFPSQLAPTVVITILRKCSALPRIVCIAP